MDILTAHLANERMKTTEQLRQPIKNREENNWPEAVRTQVNSSRFGVVQIVVHDSRVVQIEKTEKFRFESTAR